MKLQFFRNYVKNYPGNVTFRRQRHRQNILINNQNLIIIRSELAIFIRNIISHNQISARISNLFSGTFYQIISGNIELISLNA